MGQASLVAMDLLAQEATMYGTASGPVGALVRRWRQDIELALYFTQADCILQARCALPCRAGAGSFIIGRVLCHASAAGGGQPEHHMS